MLRAQHRAVSACLRSERWCGCLFRGRPGWVSPVPPSRGCPFQFSFGRPANIFGKAIKQLPYPQHTDEIVGLAGAAVCGIGSQKHCRADKIHQAAANPLSAEAGERLHQFLNMAGRLRVFAFPKQTCAKARTVKSGRWSRWQYVGLFLEN